ncbi:MAG: tRNA pseudouridine(54/55) synthase Pus10 [Nitrososphaerales archaeon]
MSSIEKSIVDLAGIILTNYPLCNWCLGRQFPSIKGDNNEIKGKMIRREVKVEIKRGSCFICQDIMQSLKDTSAKILERLKNYEFEDFLIGVKLSKDVIEREDDLRAKFKLRGGEAIKSEIKKEIGKMVASKTDKRVKFRNPDMTILLNFISGEIDLNPKPLFVYGRYLKMIRGLPQKRRKCRNCGGKGCYVCEYTGFSKEESVEQILAQRLIEKFDAKGAKFTWIGGESVESLVLGNGRPFYAEIIEPKLRHIDESKMIKKENGVILKELMVIDEKPKKSPTFIVTVSAHVKFDEEVNEEKLNTLREKLQNSEVKIKSLKKKSLVKKIYDFNVERMNKREAKIIFKCDGGLNIKRFISGSNSDVRKDLLEINPNVSEIIGIKANCDTFDILDLEVLNK